MGTQEFLLVLLVGLLLFGASRLPDLGRAIGSSIREFKKAARDDEAPPVPSEPPRPPDSSQGSSVGPEGGRSS